MNQLIEGNTLNGLTQKMMKEVMMGDTFDSRNGNCHFVNNAVLQLNNPRARHLNLHGRKNNIFSVIAELFWVMAGDINIDPFLSHFLPRAEEFSDDGTTWRGGYGKRIYANNQVQGVIDTFKTEGLNTRRAVISIYESMLDSPKGLKEVYKLDSSKDIPCNNMLHFYVAKGKLNCNAFSRSGDVVWGVSNVNIPEWTFLMEYIAQEIGVEVGVYTHSVTNLHIYDFTKGQVESVLSEPDQPVGDNTMPCIFPEGNNKARWFFRDFITIAQDYIRDEGSISFEMTLSGVLDLFARYGVPISGNLLWCYSRALVAYISGKKGDSDLSIQMPESDFKRAILASSFRKFEVL